MGLLINLTLMITKNKFTLILGSGQTRKKTGLFPILVAPSCEVVIINGWFFGLVTELLQL